MFSVHLIDVTNASTKLKVYYQVVPLGVEQKLF